MNKYLLITVFLFIAAPVFADSSICIDAYNLYLIREADPEELAQKYLDKRINNDELVILDIGGEGRYNNAINLNPQPLVSNIDSGFIPSWLPGRGGDIPLPNKVVDEIYIESAPLNAQTLDEMLRVLKPRGTIHMYHPTEYTNKYFQQLEEFMPEAFINRIDDFEGTTRIRITFP